MELIKLAGRRSKLSDIVYILLNVAYAVSLFILVSPGVDLPYLAFTLVLLSKWRVIAVRPRFWFANLQANFVDFLVGISVVTLMILTAASTPWVAALLSVFFAFWLLVLKPHNAQKWVLLQAAIAQFISLMALFSFAHSFELKPLLTDSSFLTVVIAWLIGYMAARHALSSFPDEDERSLLSLIWGFIVAELAWLAHHWTIAYSVYGDMAGSSDRQLMIPQIAIIVTLLGFITIKWYEAIRKIEDKRLNAEARSATIFAVIAITILMLFFNGSLD
ncbi:MAG: hypothetical protein ABIR46_02625, partial [Candidatus Saccharimonadales bacterium]